MTHGGAAVAALFMLAAACSGTATSTAAAARGPEVTDTGPEFDELLEVVDVVVSVLPGEGAGRFAEALAASQDGHPGTAVHLATLNTASGRTDFFSYEATPPARAPIGGTSHCVGFQGPDAGGASCGSGPILDEPTAGAADMVDDPRPGHRNSAWAYGGPEAVFAVLTTRDGSQVGIITASGFAAAEWPALWGGPTRIVFYDDNADAIYETGF